MSTIGDIRVALAGKIDAGELDVQAVHVTAAPFEFADHPMDVELLSFNVWVTVGPLSEAAEDRLDELLDPAGGIRRLLEADRTLGQLVATLGVTKCTGYQPYQTAPEAPVMLGATWTVRCVT